MQERSTRNPAALVREEKISSKEPRLSPGLLRIVASSPIGGYSTILTTRRERGSTMTRSSFT
jgi:hypothetical protein